MAIAETGGEYPEELDVSQAINLRELEREAFTSTFRDGLWDVFLGLLLMAMAVGSYLGDIGVSNLARVGAVVALEVPATLLLWVGKKCITTPRMGRVKFGPTRVRKLNRVSVVFLMFNIVFSAALVTWLVVSHQSPAWLDQTTFLTAVWVVETIVIFSVAASLLDYNRLYLIGVLFALTFPGRIVMDETGHADISALAFVVPGIVVLLMGLAVFVRFLRDCSVLVEPPSEEALNGAQ